MTTGQATFDSAAATLAQEIGDREPLANLASSPFKDCVDSPTQSRSRSPSGAPDDSKIDVTTKRRSSRDQPKPSSKSTVNQSDVTMSDPKALTGVQLATQQPSQPPFPAAASASSWLGPGSTQPLANTQTNTYATASAVAPGSAPPLNVGVPVFGLPSTPAPQAAQSVNTTIELVHAHRISPAEALIDRLKKGDSLDECYYEIVSTLQDKVYTLEFAFAALEEHVAELNARMLPRCIMTKPRDMSPKEFVSAAVAFLNSSGVKQKVLAVNKFSMPLSFWPMTTDAHGDIKESLKTYTEDTKLKASFIIYDSPTKVRCQEGQARAMLNTLKKKHEFKPQQLKMVFPGARNPKVPNQDGWSVLCEDSRRPMITCTYDHKAFKARIELDRPTFAGFSLDASQIMKDFLSFAPQYFPVEALLVPGPLLVVGRTQSLQNANHWGMNYVRRFGA